MTDAAATAPLLSICIPTFNRAEMLRTCLAELRPVVRALPFPVEVVISDNRSTDDTERVVRDISWDEWVADDPMPMRFVRPAVHLEAIEHYVEMMRHARGKYAHYLADDDALLPQGLRVAVEWMEAHPGMVACFNAQFEVEQGTDRVLGIANNVAGGPRILGRNDYLGAIDLLRDQPFHPEVPLVRSEIWRRHVARSHKTFFGFWLLASLLKVGDVGISQTLYYKHRLRPHQDGAGNQIQWEFAVDRMDQNRLGMELLFARAMRGERDPEKLARLQGFFTQRMTDYAAIAARVCIQGGDHQAAAEIMARCALWAGTDIEAFDEATLDERVVKEIERRHAAWPDQAVYPADIREALRVAR